MPEPIKSVEKDYSLVIQYEDLSKYKLTSTIEFDQYNKDSSSHNSLKPKLLMSKLNHLMKDTKSSAIRNAINRIQSPNKIGQ